MTMTNENMQRELTFCEAMKEAIQQEMRRDEKVFILGESIQAPTFPHTADLAQEFGEDRVIDTPMAEAGFYGLAYGAAQKGYRPIVDFMMGAFSYYAFADIAIVGGQQYFTHGSQTPLPMVMIVTSGTGAKLGNDHAMAVHGTYLHHPGTKVVLPATPKDAKGLMAAAVRDNNPVMFEWPMCMMMDRGDVPEGEFVIPLGVAEVKRVGKDVTVVATGAMVKQALASAETLEGEISVEVIDPRTLEPFDMNTLLASLDKTNRLVIVDDDYESGGFAATLSARVVEQGFDLLDAPIQRVTLPNMPIPGGVLEDKVLVREPSITRAIRKVCACDLIGA